jgi:hypothetical protein
MKSFACITVFNKWKTYIYCFYSISVLCDIASYFFTIIGFLIFKSVDGLLQIIYF